MTCVHRPQVVVDWSMIERGPQPSAPQGEARVARYPHTAECRDEYCVHPIQCERDQVCPPSPGGEVDVEQRQGDARVWQGKPTDPPAPGPDEIGLQVRDRYGYVWLVPETGGGQRG